MDIFKIFTFKKAQVTEIKQEEKKEEAKVEAQASLSIPIPELERDQIVSELLAEFISKAMGVKNETESDCKVETLLMEAHNDKISEEEADSKELELTFKPYSKSKSQYGGDDECNKSLHGGNSQMSFMDKIIDLSVHSLKTFRFKFFDFSSEEKQSCNED